MTSAKVMMFGEEQAPESIDVVIGTIEGRSVSAGFRFGRRSAGGGGTMVGARKILQLG